MKNNKLVMIMLIILMAIVLVGAVAIILIKQNNDDKGPNNPTIDQVLEASVDVPQITTNLASNDFIRISFKIQTDSKAAKKELEKRDFQVKDIIIQELSEVEAEDIKGKEGQNKLKNNLKGKINNILQTGVVEQVYITENLLQ